jgi:hypothetical protein
VGWPQPLGGTASRASLATVDLSGDGRPDVVVAADSAVFAFRADGAPLIGGSPRLDGDLPGPVVGEVAATRRFRMNPGIPVLESWIGVAVRGGGLHLWNTDGIHIFETGAPDATTGPIFPVTDPSEGGITELAVAGRSDGSLVGFPFGLRLADGAWCGHRPVVALGTIDRNGSGRDEVIAVSDGGLIGLFAVTEADTMAFGWPPGGVATGGGRPATRLRWVLSGDLDRVDAGSPEIVVADSSGTIHLLNGVGDEMPGWPIALGREIRTSPVLGDVDGDGWLEIIAVDRDGVVHAVSHNGVMTFGWPHAFGPGSAAAHEAPLIVCDAASDEGPEVAAYLASGHVAMIARDGRAAGGSPLDAGDRPGGGPVAADLDRDGAMDLVVAGADGVVRVLPTGQPAGRGAGEWRQAGYDSERRASFPRGRLPEISLPSSLLPDDRIACYPNPAPGDVLYVHYALGGPAEVSLELFDTAGGKVAARPGTSFAGDENRVEIPLRGLASGLYVLRLTARDGSRAITVLKKVAILR